MIAGIRRPNISSQNLNRSSRCDESIPRCASVFLVAVGGRRKGYHQLCSSERSIAITTTLRQLTASLPTHLIHMPLKASTNAFMVVLVLVPVLPLAEPELPPSSCPV